MPEFVTPPPLSPGDRVAIVAPASGLAAQFPAVYERGLERISTVFDLQPVAFPTATMPDADLAADPAARARDIEDAFAAPDIRGVVATIGGNDQIRILQHLDPAVLREHPTRFYGLSDNTNLAHLLWNQGIVSFYGGHVRTEFGCNGAMPDALERWLRTALFAETWGALEPAPRFTDEDGDWADPSGLDAEPEMVENPGWRWHGGDAAVEGRTWGGSLEITELQLVADRYAPPVSVLAGGVSLLEPSEELPKPGMVRRAVMGMGERGLLAAVDAVLLGRVKARSHEVDRPADERRANGPGSVTRSSRPSRSTTRRRRSSPGWTSGTPTPSRPCRWARWRPSTHPRRRSASRCRERGRRGRPAADHSRAGETAAHSGVGTFRRSMRPSGWAGIPSARAWVTRASWMEPTALAGRDGSSDGKRPDGRTA